MADKLTLNMPDTQEDVSTVKDYDSSLALKHHVYRKKYYQLKDSVDWIYQHPFRFMIGRLYHYYVLRDEKK